MPDNGIGRALVSGFEAAHGTSDDFLTAK